MGGCRSRAWTAGYGPETFLVRLSDGCGMEPEFGAGDVVYVDPDEPAEQCRFVAVRPCPEDAVTDYTEIGALELSIPAKRTDGSVTFRLRPTNDATAEGGEVSIEAVDDTGARLGPVTLSIEDAETVHFNSGGLEDGNAAKGLPEGVGSSEGDWRLILDSDLDFEVLSYIRTEDGFLTAMHDTVPVRDVAYEVAVFNPGSNPTRQPFVYAGFRQSQP